MDTNFQEAWRQVHNLVHSFSALVDLKEVLAKAADAEKFLASHDTEIQAKAGRLAELDQEIDRAAAEFEEMVAKHEEKAKAREEMMVTRHNQAIQEFETRKAILENSILTLKEQKLALEESVANLNANYAAKVKESEARLANELQALKVEVDTWKTELDRTKKQAKELLANLSK